jgi:molybdate transport system ATP-binding protein
VPADVLDVEVRHRAGALDLDVRLRTASRRVALFGPSGAGKTTLLRILAGLEPRAKGRVLFRGERWSGADGEGFVPAWRRRVGWVPQDVRLFPHRSVLENLRVGGGSIEEAEALARRLGVGHLLSRRPRHLSGGEAQRVALARALLSRPRLLLLDEPFAALDRPRRSEIAEALRGMLDAQDVALLLVSHDERDVRRLADEVFEMTDGRLGPVAPPAAAAP